MSERDGGGAADKIRSEYRGPKDVGRAESLYQSALTKGDPDYCLQLLFTALTVNPEHEGAFSGILSKTAEMPAGRRKILPRISDLLTGSPADEFVKQLAHFAASPSAEAGLACASEAHKIGLGPAAKALGQRVMGQLENGAWSIKLPGLVRFAEVMEECGATELAVRIIQHALRLFPNDQTLREREKNLLARKYLKEQDLAADFHGNLQDAAKQQATHRALDAGTRLDEFEQHYHQTHRLEDFREFVRSLREAPAARRESAIATLQDAFERFGEKDILWFIREIKLERRRTEVRLHRQLMEEGGATEALRAEHEQLRRDVLREEIDYLYELVSSLLPGAERQKRELQLMNRLFEAERYEEAVKQAQALRRKAECRIDAWVVMAKAFVQLGLTMEAAASFEGILKELGSDPQGTPARILDAKYSYAGFLIEEAEKKNDRSLAVQARKLCAEVILEDIDYRAIRKLSQRAEALNR